MALGLTNSIGLLALGFLIPLIIIYLIKPQPKKISIPSLMFLTQQYKKSKTQSFLRKILKDPLFVLQLLVLLFLIFSLTDPWYDTTKIISTENTILVLDISASMQAQDRFEKAIDKAKSNLGSRNTIILSQTTPLITLQDATKSEARSFLNTLKPTDGSSDIGNAIVLASEFAKEESKVIVISDFIHTQGISPLTAKSVLESKDIPTEFINVGKESKNNIAIIDAKIDYEKTTIFIKNYNAKEEKIKLKINNLEADITIPKGSTETYSFKTPKGTTKIEIEHEDDLEADNIAFISNPSEEKIKVNLISNLEPRYLLSALESLENIEVKRSEPPVIEDGEFDVYIFYGINPSKMIRGVNEEIMKSVEKGKSSVIIHSQKTIDKINYGPLLPIKIGQFKQENALIEPVRINTLTKDIDFGETRGFLSVQNKNGVKTIASANKEPIISEINFNGGHLIYYGIIEEESDFKLSPSYPIFWTRLLKIVSNKKDLFESNVKTGITLNLKKDVVLDKIKTYKLGKSTIAVNLFNERESDLNIEKLKGIKIKEYEAGTTKTKHKQPLEEVLIVLAFLFFLGELIYSKIRGEL